MPRTETIEIPFVITHGADCAAVGPSPDVRSQFRVPDLRAIANTDKASELYIYDDIGPSWLGMIDGQAVVEKLADVGSGELVVRINSRGGDVVEGIAIYNALKRFDQTEGNRVTVAVDSLAASAASLIAMAGGKVVMADNASMMVHQVWSFAWGNALELRKVADILSHYDENVASTYKAKTGLERGVILDMMKAETWMNAEEAKTAGFIDEIGDATDVEPPQMKAGWYQGPDPKRTAAASAKRFGDLDSIDRSLQIRRKRLALL